MKIQIERPQRNSVVEALLIGAVVIGAILGFAYYLLANEGIPSIEDRWEKMMNSREHAQAEQVVVQGLYEPEAGSITVVPASQGSQAAPGASESASGLPGAHEPSAGLQDDSWARFEIPGIFATDRIEVEPWSATLDPSTDYLTRIEGEGWGGLDLPDLLVIHSCGGSLSCEGSSLVQHADSIIPGSDLFYEGERYTIAVAEEISKDELGSSAVWSNLDAGSLVLITCDFSAGVRDGHAVSNLAIRAQRA